jgi:ketosteroid isomerase-like protein
MVADEPADPRVETVIKTLDAYRSANLQSMQQHMALDVTLEAGGDNPLSGTYEGLGGVMAFIGKSTATFVTGTVLVEEIEPREDEVRVMVKGEMLLVGGETAAVRVLQRYWFREDGKIAWIRAEAGDDPEEFDRLLRDQARRL